MSRPFPPVAPACSAAPASRLPRLSALALAVAALPGVAQAQIPDPLQAAAGSPIEAAAEPGAAGAPVNTLEAIQVSGNWFGTGLQNSARNFAGARTVVGKQDIDASGASSFGELMRRIPGVQASENSGSAGSAISLNIGVRGLTGRYSPRSTVLLDGIPLAVAPYGQPQLSFAPVSLNNMEGVDVVRGGGAVRYGPQNVGGIINFRSRAIPSEAGLVGDVSVRQNDYAKGEGHNTQYSAFFGSQLDSGLGLALLYSGLSGSDWRAGSDEKVNDIALKFRYELGATSEVYGKLSYYDVSSRTPGGLSVAQYQADPFQNTRPTDFWNGDRRAVDVGYLNTLSATQEFEIRSYYSESSRQSALINAARTQLAYQPRNYQVLGIEPRYTQRLSLGATTHDLTLGYRFLRERGDDNSYSQTLASGALGATTTFDNATDAQAVYLDDKIALGAWRVTPGLRFEHIQSQRDDRAAGQRFDVKNNKSLPSLNVAYLLTQDLTLFANYGSSFGPVQNTQLNSQTPANPLRPELARTVELGSRWSGRGLNAELTVFRIRFDNQIQQVPGSNPAVFQNIGATQHQGVESAVDYSFDKHGPLAGLNVYANYSYTRALQESGPSAGLDVPFYARNTDTVGARYTQGDWSFNLSSTHQSSQYSDNANTVAENAAATVGRVPGFRLWNAQASWKLPFARGAELLAGVNNLADKRYYTRNVDANAGRMVGAPRMVYLQGRYAF
ncbi:MAG: TonB-dependent siderophore receptor [Burkholderiaceae bacterium]